MDSSMNQPEWLSCGWPVHRGERVNLQTVKLYSDISRARGTHQSRLIMPLYNLLGPLEK